MQNRRQIDAKFLKKRLIIVVITATLASIGTAGVPGVGIVMLVIVLQSIDIPTDAIQGGIAMILGVDRILDMCRTTVNVFSDASCAVLVARSEGEPINVSSHS